MALFCNTCNVGVSSEITMRDHVKGRRHLQAVAAAERRRAVAKCSLYCRDFPMSTTEAMLHQYFSQFGSINRVMLVTEKGHYCIVHFNSESAVQEALAHPNHQLLGSQLTVRPRRPITVNTGHSQQSEAHSHIQRSKAAMSEKVEAQKKADHEHLMKTLLKAQSVLEQMELLHNDIRLSDEDLKNRNDLCETLHSHLLPFFPTCTIHAFGSSVSGYGMKGSDLDVFLDFHDDEVSHREEEELKKTLQQVALPYVGDIRNLPAKSGPLLPSHLRNVPLVDRVRLLSRLLTLRGHCFADVCTIPSARCPITRFIHTNTGTKCDMSINNRLALKNTQLLRLCSQERRVQLLMFAVRYWANWRQMAGNAGSGPRMSNYCLTLLVMFYLANTDPPVLPSVEELSEMAEEECFIEGWNCSIPSVLPRSDNRQSADELLHGFFEFFSHIDFSSDVILTRTATTLTLQEFLAEQDSDPALKNFKIRAMAVQDPFVLSHNISYTVNSRMVDLLTAEIRTGASKTAGWNSSDPRSSAGSSSFAGWGLPCLFSSLGCQGHNLNTVSTPLTGTKQSKAQTCSLSLDLSKVSPQNLISLHATGDYRSAWYKCVHRLLLQTLRDVFLFRLFKENGDPIEEDLDSSQEEPSRQPGSLQNDSNQNISEDDEDEVETDGQEMEGECYCGKSWQEDEDLSDSKSLQATSSQGVNCFCPQHSLWSPGFKWPMPTPVDSSRSTYSAPIKSRYSPKYTIKQQTSNSASAFAGKKRGRNEPQQHRLSKHRGPEIAVSSASNGHRTREGSTGGGCSSPFYVSTALSDQQQTPGSSANLHCPSHQASGHLKVPEEEGMALAGEDDPAVLLIVQPSEADCGIDSPSCSKDQVSQRFISPSTPVEEVCLPTAKQSGSCNSLERSTLKQVVSKDENILPRDNTGGGKFPWSGLPTENVPESISMDWELNAGCQDMLSTTGTSRTLSGSSPQGSSCSGKMTHQQGADNSPAKMQSVKRTACPRFLYLCEGHCRTWHGRKALRADALEKGLVDGCQLEKFISQQIYLRDSGSSLEPIKFKCALSMVENPDKTEAEVNFEPCTPMNDFFVFVAYFRSFFSRAVSHHLTSVSTTT